MTNAIIIIILVLIAGGAGMYLYKAKKRGEHCVGCPYAKQCSKNSCNCNETK